MIKFIKVTGNSLSPIFLPDDFVLVSSWPVKTHRLQTGDTVVFIHHELGLLIKQVKEIDKNFQNVTVEGIHPNSTNHIKLGQIPIDNIIGKVIWHIKQPR